MSIWSTPKWSFVKFLGNLQSCSRMFLKFHIWALLWKTLEVLQKAPFSDASMGSFSRETSQRTVELHKGVLGYFLKYHLGVLP